ncbi:MAG: flavin reductase family protein [Geminicoccaceae bacterium]|nr:flavin reductase family protein [Geminicoccaceae bacterium]
MTIDGDGFRAALGCFATGITVVTARSRGRPVGLTVNSFNSVSLDPPLVLFSLGRHTHVYWDLLEAPHFAVNVLAQDQRPLSERFAAPPASGRFKGVAWRDGPFGSPLIGGTAARLECTVAHKYQGGDHVILVGRVLHLEAEPHRRPLLYHQSAYAALAPEPLAPEPPVPEPLVAGLGRRAVS